MMQKETRSMKLFMRLHDRSYDIILKQGSLDNLGRFTDLTHRPVMVVTDAGVPQDYAKRVLAQCGGGGQLFCAPQGSRCKSLETYGRLMTALSQGGIGRSGLIVAVGGGAVADLAGFAAATYQGGIGFANCPTTTLAQMSPCLDGGARLDLGGALGSAGIRRQPDLVVVDPALQATLPPRLVACGLAEALRIALPCAPDLFTRLENSQEPLEEMEELLWLTMNAKKNLLEYPAPGGALDFGLAYARLCQAERGAVGRRTGGLYYGECLPLGFLPLIQDAALTRRTRALCRRFQLPWRWCDPAQALLPQLAQAPEAEEGRLPLARVTGLGCWEHCVLDLSSGELAPVRRPAD